MEESSQNPYRPPLFEYKTVQVYPSEYTERETIKIHEKCGWQCTGSNRQQERHGDTISTFTRISFQRDKNMPNYEKIRELSELALSCVGKTYKSSMKRGLGFLLALGSLCVFVPGVMLKSLLMSIIGGGVLALGIFLIVRGIMKEKKNKAIFFGAQSRAERAADECQRIIRGQ